MSFSNLFVPIRIGGCRLKNRFVLPLFPTKYATESRVNPKMVEFYRARAKGGVAMIVLDCLCLDYPRAYKGPQELQADSRKYVSGISQLLQASKAEGARAFMQLNYPKERAFERETPGAVKKGDAWIVSLANRTFYGNGGRHGN
ncbi:MAG: hypothetical protein GY866_19700 [Proteobacteria bacterium]|nr:hypothetical protein [Pseudomonadota bacterium]